MAEPFLSIVVVEYNMAREIERTIVSLSATYQRDIGENDYEVILVDNGSSAPSNKENLRKILPGIRLHTIERAGVSPVEALNAGIAMARGTFVGVSIDGARMFSPGVLSSAMRALSLYERGVIYPLGFHLGHAPQNLAKETGYNQSAEDLLLDSVNWQEDGYRLFDISVVAPGQAPGWFRPLAEATALFMPRSMWDEIGGVDARFQSPGGGFVNLDRFHREYVSIRGKSFEVPVYQPMCFGCAHAGFLRSLENMPAPGDVRGSGSFLAALGRFFGSKPRST